MSMENWVNAKKMMANVALKPSRSRLARRRVVDSIEILALKRNSLRNLRVAQKTIAEATFE